MSTVLITCHHVLRHIHDFAPLLETQGITVIAPQITGQQFNAHEMSSMIDGVDIVIAGDDEISRDVIACGAASSLKAIIRWGIGVDSVDLDAAREFSIPVYNTPGVFSDEVADLAFTFLLMLARPLHKMHAGVCEGKWKPISGRTLRGLNAGIIGLGSIGQAIASRCGGFGMHVMGCDAAQLPEEVMKKCGVSSQTSLENLLEQSDVVFIACALTPHTHHMIDDAAFDLMKPDAYLINVGRGPIVKETALVKALSEAKIAAAGMDVFEVEPLPQESALRQFDNIIFGCHCGSNTQEAVHRINTLTTNMALQLLGKQPQMPLSLNRVV